jgi:hypothetical protein
MNSRSKATSLLAAAVLLAAQSAAAEQSVIAESGDESWRFGIGTGISSFSLDGDIGFATSAGGLITEIDVDNSDTSDMLDSAAGFTAFAEKNLWRINLSAGTRTLEDSDSGLDLEWDYTTFEGSVTYKFATTGYNRWSALLGVRYTEHEWTIESATDDLRPEDDWTDVLIGLVHELPIGNTWSWSNRVDYGFGGSEGTVNAVTTLGWKPLPHWMFYLNARYLATEHGDEDDIEDSDFYFYDVDEPSLGLGFLFVF